MNSGNTRVIETTLSKSNVDAQIAALLYAVGLVKDNEDIVELDYKVGDTTVPMKIKIKEEREVKRISHSDG